MNERNKSAGKEQDDSSGKDSGRLERLARLIDPPGREVSDDELIDPGANIPDTPRKEDKPPSGRQH